MSLIGAIRTRPLLFLFGLAAVSLIGLGFVPRIPQPQAYHQFADRDTLLGIPNFWNVVSNLGFILVGAWGLVRARGSLSASIFFLGVFLTGFSSSYTLGAGRCRAFWGRLPISVAFIKSWRMSSRADRRTRHACAWPLSGSASSASGVASLRRSRLIG